MARPLAVSGRTAARSANPSHATTKPTTNPAELAERLTARHQSEDAAQGRSQERDVVQTEP